MNEEILRPPTEVVECPHCHKKLGVSASDIRFNVGCGNGSYAYMTCFACRGFVSLDCGVVSKDMIRKAEKG